MNAPNANLEAMEASPAHTRCMQFAKRLDEEWRRLVTAMTAFRQSMDGTEIMDVVELSARDYATPSDYVYQSRVFGAVTRYAAKVLSPTATPLALNLEDLRDRFVPDQYMEGRRSPAKLEAFSAAAVMSAVLDSAEPRAEEDGLRQLADRFFNTFRRAAPRSVGGRIVFTIGAYTYDRKFGCTNEYEYSTRQEIEQTLALFAEVLQQLGIDGFLRVTTPNMQLTCVREFQDAGWKVDRAFRAHFGPIEIRTFQRKVEFHVPAKIAEAINLFVGTHRTPERVVA